MLQMYCNKNAPPIATCYMVTAMVFLLQKYYIIPVFIPELLVGEIYPPKFSDFPLK